MAKLSGEEREIILNALQEVGLEPKELKGVANLNDARLIAFADQFINNSDEDEEDEEEIDDEDLDDEVDSDEESEDEDEDEVTGNSEDEDEESEDFEDEELVDNEEYIDEDEEETVRNGCDSMKKKKKKGATMNRRELTAQEWMDSAPPEIAEVVNNALAHSRDQKAALIEKLTANLSGEKKKDMIRKLANNTLSQLQDLATLIPSASATKPQVRVPRQAVHIGAGGVTANSRKEKDASEPLIPPTINWSELKEEFSGK